jgi:cell division protein ZapE
MTTSLVGRLPSVTSDELISGLVPPPHFDHVRFDNYLPDAMQPTQSSALENLRNFAIEIEAPKKFWMRRAPGLRARYLDGGFGVGKTHLLAALWHEVDVPKAFGTFVEFTNLVGALGFNETVEKLKQFKLVCIDEFELDDPGDTVLMSTLLMRLVEAGVYLAATSNTLPDRLGEERFAADDFQREIQGLAAHFENIRVDGDDYRHRGIPTAIETATEEQLQEVASSSKFSTLDNFKDLSVHLSKLHPSKYRALIQGVEVACISKVETISDQAVALRWVVLADRLYDQDVRIVTSGVKLDVLFAPELLKGGYRKKYRRALSRLIALSQI